MVNSTLHKIFKFSFLHVALLVAFTAGAQSPQVFSSSGTFTVPSCVTSFTVQCWGGGGGGGGANSANGGAAGAGGGGGGFATATFNNVSGTYTVIVGVGGNGGIGTSSTGPFGANGGNSIVTNGVDSIVVVGGKGGAGSTGGVAAGVGTGGGGYFVGTSGTTYLGGNGGMGNNQDNNIGGGGGGGAGNSGNGAAANNTGRNSNSIGGAGGAGNPNTAQYAGGAGGNVTADYYENGGNGAVLGGGGGGGGGETSGGVFGHGTSPGTGGNGAHGQVIITYTTSSPTITNVTGSGCPGNTVTVTGTLLSGATSVTIGSTALTNIQSTATTVTGTIANGTSTGSVTVITPCGNATSSAQFVINTPATVQLGTQSICAGGTYNFGGHTYSTAGAYADTTSSTITGCDSITNVTLVLAAPAVVNLGTESICSGASYVLGNNAYTAAGTYSDTTSSVITGCDSITTVTLTINAHITVNLGTQSICAGSGYILGGNVYNTPGTYADTTSSVVTGCDSITTVTLTLAPPAVYSFTDSICTGSSYSFNGNSYTTAGTYIDTLTGAGVNGCDSVVTLVLGIKTSSASTVTVTTNQPSFCPGDSSQVCATTGFVSYAWANQQSGNCIYVHSPGNYYVTATDQNGCTVTSNHLTVNVYSGPSISITINGDTLKSHGAVSYQWFLNTQPIAGATDSVYVASQTGNYTVELTDANGCHATSNPTTITVAGIDNVSAATAVSVYPNPTNSGSWHLNVNEALIGGTYEVFDAAGRLMDKAEIRSTASEIEFDAAKGIYILQIHVGATNYALKLVKL